MPDEGMRTFPEVLGVAASTSSRAGPTPRRRSSTTLELDDDDDSGQLGFADGCAALGLALLQLGQVDDAIDVLARGYADVDRRRPRDVDRLPARARLRGRAPHRRRRRRRSRSCSAAPAARSPTACSRCGPRASCARSRARPTRAAPVDAAYEIATATDAPLEHAIAALARAKVLAALGTDDADDAADDADLPARRARPHRRRLAADLRPRARRRQRSLVTHRRGAELIEHDVAGEAVGERRHAGRHLAARHDVAHDLGEAAHRIVVPVGAGALRRAPRA